MQEEKQHLLRMKARLHYIELVEKNGGFWSLEPPPATEYQWRVDYAIKQEFCNDASTLYKMTIPEGSSLGALEGKVGPQGMGLYGGAHQAYIDYRAVPADWIEITPATWK